MLISPCVWIQKKRDFASTPAFKLNLGKKKDNPLLGQIESHQFNPRPYSVVPSCEKSQKLLQINTLYLERVARNS